MLEIGTRFAVVMQVTRLVERGEKIKLDDGTEMDIYNPRSDKVWARFSASDKTETLFAFEPGFDPHLRLAIQLAEVLDNSLKPVKHDVQK